MERNGENMKKKWYRKNGIKFVLIMITVLSVMVGCVCGGSILWLMSRYGIRPLDVYGYEESQSFVNNVSNRAYTILEALRDRAILDESKGDILVDLTDLLDNGELTGKNTHGIAYKAEDLLQWCQTSWETEENILICTQEDGTDHYMYYQDFEKKIWNEELRFEYEAVPAEENISDSTILRSLYDQMYSEDVSGIRELGVKSVEDQNGNILYTNVRNYLPEGDNDIVVQEQYTPDGAESILDILNDDEKWNGRIHEAYCLLNEALSKYSRALNAEAELQCYADGNSNLSYLYAETSFDTVYSNMEHVSSANYKTVLQKMTSENNLYMVIAPKQKDCALSFSTDMIDLAHWQQLVGNVGLYDSNYIYAISIDREFAVLDDLAAEKVYYDKYGSWGIPMILLMGAAILLFFGGISVLTVGAGRSNDDDGLHLNWFDRWYTEIAASVVLIIWICGFFAIIDFTGWMYSRMDESMFIMMIAAAGMGFWTSVWLDIGWLSLVRRIKAKSLWKNSLIRLVLLLPAKIISKCTGYAVFLGGNLENRVKMILKFAAFAFGQILCSVLAFGDGNPFFLLILVVSYWALLYYLVKDIWGKEQIVNALKKITDGDIQYKIPLDKLNGVLRTIAEYINHVGEGLDAAVENSLKNERMKTELITNVSHDIKTPLTSIINYIDLLKRENLEDPKIQGYLDVLESKAQRLKILTEDVVEASKASTGNISLDMTELNFVELVNQVIGEFEEKFQEKNLTMVVHFDEEEAILCADGRRLWRVLENIFGNVSKYAMENTRVYADIKVRNPKVQFSLKNISAQPLNISANELTERFIRGDMARNTEGSGLGLSIAKDLTVLQGGEFRLYLDGDLFKVTIEFQMI